MKGEIQVERFFAKSRSPVYSEERDPVPGTENGAPPFGGAFVFQFTRTALIQAEYRRRRDEVLSEVRIFYEPNRRVLFRAHGKPPSDRGFFIFLFLKNSSSTHGITASNQNVTIVALKKSLRQERGKENCTVHFKLIVFIPPRNMILYTGSSVNGQSLSDLLRESISNANRNPSKSPAEACSYRVSPTDTLCMIWFAKNKNACKQGSSICDHPHVTKM